MASKKRLLNTDDLKKFQQDMKAMQGVLGDIQAKMGVMEQAEAGQSTTQQTISALEKRIHDTEGYVTGLQKSKVDLGALKLRRVDLVTVTSGNQGVVTLNFPDNAYLKPPFPLPMMLSEPNQQSRPMTINITESSKTRLVCTTLIARGTLLLSSGMWENMPGKTFNMLLLEPL